MPAVNKQPIASSIMIQASTKSTDSAGESWYLQMKMQPLGTNATTQYGRTTESSSGRVVKEFNWTYGVDPVERASANAVRDALIGSNLVRTSIPYQATPVPDDHFRIAFSDADGK